MQHSRWVGGVSSMGMSSTGASSVGGSSEGVSSLGQWQGHVPSKLWTSNGVEGSIGSHLKILVWRSHEGCSPTQHKRHSGTLAYNMSFYLAVAREEEVLILIRLLLEGVGVTNWKCRFTEGLLPELSCSCA
eukprot:1158851-Pelagomonas_calceolata.AAC.5